MPPPAKEIMGKEERGSDLSADVSHGFLAGIARGAGDPFGAVVAAREIDATAGPEGERAALFTAVARVKALVQLAGLKGVGDDVVPG
jgi:superfamily I DNA and RNA helicase